jgi:hypothetical protein
MDLTSDVGAVRTLMRQMFGVDWSFVMKNKRNGKLVSTVPSPVHNDAMAAIQRMRRIRKEEDLGWSTTFGMFDFSKEAAATVIQACWRGWHVRKALRYSPHNRLGQHVIMRMFM